MPESLELHRDIQMIKHGLNTQNQLLKILLSLEKDKLLQQAISTFIGKRGDLRKELVNLYLAIGSGKTRSDLVSMGFSQGTVKPFCLELLEKALLKPKEIRSDGQEVLEYTVIEEIARLSRHLKNLLKEID